MKGMILALIGMSMIVSLFSTVSTQAYVSSNADDKYINEPVEAAMSPTSADLIIAKLGMQFQLKINQTATIEVTNIKVKFVKVTEDSRCPSGVQCVWEGQARILITIMKNNKKIIDLDLSTNPGFGDLGFKAFDKYSIRFVKLEPYPSRGEMIRTSDYFANMIVEQIRPEQSPDRILVKGIGNYGKVLAAWSYEGMKGVMITFHPDGGRFVLHLKLTFADCVHFHDSDDCIVASQVYTDQGPIPMAVRLEVDNKDMKLFFQTLDKSAEEFLFDIENMKKWSMNTVSEERSKVILTEGEREGSLLVHEIHHDRVEGLNFLEYPVATDKGLPITLSIGESASNGCTVTLTLLAIHDTTATFLKIVDMNKLCPIC